MPADLENAFNQKPHAITYYLSLSKSVKKIILSWLLFAKTTETRQKRIREIVDQAAQNLKPKHLQ